MASGDEINNNLELNYNMCDEMETALTAITNEINKLNVLSEFPHKNNKIEDYERVLKKLMTYKIKLMSKKKCILKLKDGMRIARFIVKLLIITKTNEVALVNDNLGIAKIKLEHLTENDKNQCRIIESLTKENKIVRDELQHLKGIIDSGYKQIYQDISLEEDKPSIVKLKDIIIHCSKNDSEFDNIKQKLVQVLQRNRFLNNKLNIINQNLVTSSDALWNYRNQILRLQKENLILKNKNIVEQQKAGNFTLTGHFKRTQSNYIKYSNANFKFDTNAHIYMDPTDLKSRLTIVKKILNDQDTILKELSKLSQDYLISDSNCQVE